MAKVDDSVEFGRIRDVGDNVLVIHRRHNHQGHYLELSSNPRRGRGSRILIPEESNGLGWMNLADVLERHFSSSKERQSNQLFVYNRHEYPHLSQNPDRKKGKRNHAYNGKWLPKESLNLEKTLDKWSRAMCVERVDKSLSWSEIAFIIQRALR